MSRVAARSPLTASVAMRPRSVCQGQVGKEVFSRARLLPTRVANANTNNTPGGWDPLEMWSPPKCITNLTPHVTDNRYCIREYQVVACFSMVPAELDMPNFNSNCDLVL